MIGFGMFTFISNRRFYLRVAFLKQGVNLDFLFVVFHLFHLLRYVACALVIS